MTTKQELEQQLKVAQQKLKGKIPFESWETKAGIEEHLKNLEQQLAQEETQDMPGGFPTNEPKPLKKACSLSDLKPKPAQEQPITPDLTKELSQKIKELQEKLSQEKTALLFLAKQKIKNKKEASELLKQLEEKWTKEEIEAMRWKEAWEICQTLKESAEKEVRYLKQIREESQTELTKTKEDLATAHQQIQAQEADYSEQFELKEAELAKKQEIITVFQHRNADLQTKLTEKDQELTQLTDWINQLEGASAPGDAFANLQQELQQSKQQILALSEQLAGKYPKNYWVYAVIAIAIVYLVLR